MCFAEYLQRLGLEEYLVGVVYSLRESLPLCAEDGTILAFL